MTLHEFFTIALTLVVALMGLGAVSFYLFALVSSIRDRQWDFVVILGGSGILLFLLSGYIATK